MKWVLHFTFYLYQMGIVFYLFLLFFLQGLPKVYIKEKKSREMFLF